MGADRRRSAPGATVGRAALAALFAVVPRVVYEVRVSGVEHDPAASPTCYAIQHKRDLDPLAPLPTLAVHRGWSVLAGDLRFAMRADAFAPGFLARIIGRPRWLAFVTHPLSVGPVLRWLGVLPLESPRLRPAEHWIRDALPLAGNVPACKVVAPAQIRLLAGTTGETEESIGALPLSALLAWRYQAALQRFCSADILLEPWRSTVRRDVIVGVRRTLSELAGWLHEGGSVFYAPEGQLSPDGRLGTVTAGFHRLVRAGPAQLTVVPIVVTYDNLTTSWPRLFVDIGVPFEAAPDLPSHVLDTRLRSAWLQTGRFTTTQIASGYLVERSQVAAPDASFTLDDLTDVLTERAGQLYSVGRRVDERLLQPSGARALAQGYLSYGSACGFVLPGGVGRWVPAVGDLTISVAPRDVGYRDQPLAYAYNEWRELTCLDVPVSVVGPSSAPGQVPL